MNDTISREAVNGLIDELARAISDEKCNLQRGRKPGKIMADILSLPSVEPERKTEHWIDGGKIGLGMGAHDYICSGCHWHKSDFPETISESRYCQSCGAQMETETPPLSPLGKWLAERAEHDPFYKNLRQEQEDT